MFNRKKRKYTRHYDRLNAASAFNLSPEVKKSIFIIFLVALGGVSLLSLFSLAGFLGEYVNSGLIALFGWGRIIFPALILGFAFLLYNEAKEWVHGYIYVGLFFFLLSFQSLLHIFFQANPEAAVTAGKGGGYVGLFLAKIFVSVIGFWASLLVLFCLLAISLVLIFDTSISGIFGESGFFGRLFAPFYWLFNKMRGRQSAGEEGEEDEGMEELIAEEEMEFSENKEGADFNSHKVAEANGTLRQLELAREEERPTRLSRSNIRINLPLDLLSDKVGRPSGADIKISNEVIKRTLENFGIPVEMGEISVGPTVTQYTFKPAEGIKLTRITTLSNDLALALATHPIRIEAPIPGKSLVGVEVPNRVIARVGLREILDTREFRERKYNTMISLGKDVAGQAWLANLAKMPHLLVAGATGSGKSVCLNSIIVSLLYQNNPDDLKFILVDPKRVEFPVYNGIPYLLTPVITDVPKTINALKWCLNEMDRRFDVLAAAGKRNIDSYNATAKERMPAIIFIIDELADLMVTAARDVEGAIIRLSQMARAVGIHLILATQRPSVDVITGLIKANIPARIAFAVSSSIDSRTILDSQGAEKLLGRGDMLFVTAELSKPKRIQGAYVDDHEIKRIINYIKDQAGEVEYNEQITGRQKVGGIAGTGFNDGDGDDLYEEAKEIVINSGKASTSFLQRRLRVGYARAARLIDLLEEGGIVGPGNGAKAREILISKEQYAKVAEIGTAGAPLHNRAESRFNVEEVLGESSYAEASEDKEETQKEIEEDSEEFEESENEDEEGNIIDENLEIDAEEELPPVAEEEEPLKHERIKTLKQKNQESEDEETEKLYSR
ncbi:cell division protein FtsK [Candidatus Falkowbacteria bacterium CG10_big_fil_rev_8_21_14_0_10_43_11]|uniref:Cell division protein FtsK n=1 Tax=Candidatus Falkowbacteria bacterium CG10_big_fil_rev_8_21_14_0_10_43_11 TaxID=1974568 RepID=A0A2M6WMW6_9BACT|nr:MAG: cell division protein FtsK [Candidatus Falkowbacteria bacterium CG10_big_fil_rev_8_21_14_0_10_43_11]